jgi:CheY-like chemotaxis protein
MILVVDDEHVDLEMIRVSLVKAGYSVVTASNGKDALKICQRYGGLIRLLITDVAMAPIDGCVLANRMIELESNLPVLFVSGYVGELALRDRHEPLPRSAFLRKPFTSDQLLAKVRELIEPKHVRAASGYSNEY